MKKLTLFCIFFTSVISFFSIILLTYFLDFRENVKPKFLVEKNIDALSNLNSNKDFSVDQETLVTAKLSIPYLEESGWQFEDAQNFIDAKASVTENNVKVLVNGVSGEIERAVFEESFYFSSGTEWENISKNSIDRLDIEDNSEIFSYHIRSDFFNESYIKSLIRYFTDSMESQGILKSDYVPIILEEPEYSIIISTVNNNNEVIIEEELIGDLDVEVDFVGKNLDQKLVQNAKSTFGTIKIKNVRTTTIINFSDSEFDTIKNNGELFLNFLKKTYLNSN